MKAKWMAVLAGAVAAAALVQGKPVGAQQFSSYQPNLYNNPNQAYQLQRFYYYPYYYFPHNYWPATSPRYPEGPGQPYMQPPAYMALPPFHEPNWRYDYTLPARYYSGFHFWLDQF
jgi:hypothetical protein